MSDCNSIKWTAAELAEQWLALVDEVCRLTGAGQQPLLHVGYKSGAHVGHRPSEQLQAARVVLARATLAWLGDADLARRWLAAVCGLSRGTIYRLMQAACAAKEAQ
jgi:hypothetical protein